MSKYTGAVNPGLALVTPLVLQQVQLCWSIISATVPNLKSFVKSFSSGFGIQLDPESTRSYGSGRYGRSNGYELGSVDGNGTSKSRSAQLSYNEIETKPAVPHQRDTVTPTTRDQESIDSSGSQDHIIRKDVRWDVHYETKRNSV